MFEHVKANNGIKLLILAINLFDIPGDISARHEQIRRCVAVRSWLKPIHEVRLRREMQN